ncbi:response regulator transcription factor [Cohnella nanjingensis]|uniref:Response regulator n=1 Tax=Cohnella nanjingensis TaxID=1387779 RepID=A0A7X0VEX6_9BACL|nr:helix-turn-helix domain-containing protein [Cohnella nanjingensis]MBB6670029.1 response regulator [Cohnella nanjingensis]
MYRYIVIDDETLIRKAIVKKIASLDLPLAWVGEACDGEEGLALALRENPDIVLTDMRMPTMDGVSLLRVLAERQPETGLIVISGFSDFEYTREAIATNVIDYMLKPFDNNELRASLEKAIAFCLEKENRRRAVRERELALESERLSAWLCRSGADERAPLRAEQYRSGPIRELLASDSFAVGLLSVTVRDSECANQDVEGSARGISARLAESSVADGHGMHGAAAGGSECSEGEGVLRLSHPDRPDVTLLVVGSRPAAARFAWGKLRQAVEEARRCGGSAVGAVSGTHGRPEELRLAYREAAALLEQRPFVPWAGVLQAHDAAMQKTDWKWPRRDDLLFEIEEGHVERAVNLTGDLFGYIRAISGVTLAQAKHYCALLARDIAEKRHRDSEAADESDKDILGWNETIREAPDPAELVRRFTGLARSAAENAIAVTSTAAGQMGQIRHYIDQRYAQPIRLEEVAERFYLHPVYLSMVFKENTGETFQDYLKRLRMERAKELLVSNKYRIDRIATMIGYENAKYFYKVFKKETGLTPAEYRKRQEEGE